MPSPGVGRNSSSHDVMIQRRQQVARLRLRGLSIRDIVQALEGKVRHLEALVHRLVNASEGLE